MALPLLFPDLQKTTTGTSEGKRPSEAATVVKGMLIAPGTLPPLNSSGVLTSTKKALSGNEEVLFVFPHPKLIRATVRMIRAKKYFIF